MPTKPYTLKYPLSPGDVEKLDRMLEELYAKVGAVQVGTKAQQLTRTVVGE